MSVDVFKVTEGVGVDNEVLDRPAVRILKRRRVKLWILDLVRDDLELCVYLYFTQTVLPLDDLGDKFLIRIVDNVTDFKFLVEQVSS